VKEAKRHVTHDELEIVAAADRELGGRYHIIALALKTAWICAHRSSKVRRVAIDAITDAGILRTDSKDPTKLKILIEWSPELKQTVDETRAIKRNKLAGSFLLFGTCRGSATQSRDGGSYWARRWRRPRNMRALWIWSSSTSRCKTADPRA